MNTNNTTLAGYSDDNLRECLWMVANSAQLVLTLSPMGWGCSVGQSGEPDEILILTHADLGYLVEGMSPEDYTEGTYDTIASHIEASLDEMLRLELGIALANPNATSERLEALRAILRNLRNA